MGKVEQQYIVYAPGPEGTPVVHFPFVRVMWVMAGISTIFGLLGRWDWFVLFLVIEIFLMLLDLSEWNDPNVHAPMDTDVFDPKYYKQ